MEDLQAYYTMVENVIKSLGVDPAICRGDKPGMWKMTKGSAEVWIDVWHIESEQRAYIQVCAPVMQVPTKNAEAFYQELLELNDQMYAVAFTKYQNWVYVKTIRELANLQEEEILATLNRVGVYCDDYDDMLKTKYTTTAPGNPPA